MKLLIVLAVVVMACADFQDDSACLGSAEAATCYKNFVACRKNYLDFRSREKCLMTFDRCVAGPCPVKCVADYKSCQHKAQNAEAIVSCHASKRACDETCKTVLIE